MSPPLPAPTPIMTTRRTAILGALLMAIGPISMAIYTPAMPELVKAFGTTESAIKISLALYFAGFALAQLVSGPASDAFGRKVASLVFLSIYLAGGLIAVFAPSVEFLLAARLIQGIGVSVGMTVARAIVRDQFIGSEASSILNLIGIMLAIGPAIGPTMGGLSLAAFGWHSVFWLMVGFGGVSVVAVVFFLLETTVPDRKLIRPGNLVRAYAELLRNKRFLFAAMIMAGSVGALYAQATMLSFILINEVGLTPTGFGLSMLMQSGAYFSGSVALRFLVKILGDRHSAILGLCCSGIGGTFMILSVFLLEPSFITIMGPVAVATFGIALITPYIVTAAMAPFPHIAGSASAMMGFIQMSSGFIAGVVASLIGSPLLAFGTVIPFMEFMAIAGYIGFASFTRKTA